MYLPLPGMLTCKKKGAHTVWQDKWFNNSDKFAVIEILLKYDLPCLCTLCTGQIALEFCSLSASAASEPKLQIQSCSVSQDQSINWSAMKSPKPTDLAGLTSLILQSAFLAFLTPVDALQLSTPCPALLILLVSGIVVATVTTALPSSQLSWGQQFGLSEQQIHSIVRLWQLFCLRHGRRVCWRPRCKQGDTEKDMKSFWNENDLTYWIDWMYTTSQWNCAWGQYGTISQPQKLSLEVSRIQAECDLWDPWDLFLFLSLRILRSGDLRRRALCFVVSSQLTWPLANPSVASVVRFSTYWDYWAQVFGRYMASPWKTRTFCDFCV